MIEVAVATTPFLDLTFTGLGAIPRPEPWGSTSPGRGPMRRCGS